MSLHDDLEYLRTAAFEFHLEINPHAACSTPIDDFHAGDGQGYDPDDWLSDVDHAEALRTGRFVHGHVYPCGSVGFFSISGQDVAAVTAWCAARCREDQAEYHAQGLEPGTPTNAVSHFT